MNSVHRRQYVIYTIHYDDDSDDGNDDDGVDTKCHYDEYEVSKGASGNPLSTDYELRFDVTFFACEWTLTYARINELLSTKLLWYFDNNFMINFEWHFWTFVVVQGRVVAVKWAKKKKIEDRGLIRVPGTDAHRQPLAMLLILTNTLYLFITDDWAVFKWVTRSDRWFVQLFYRYQHYSASCSCCYLLPSAILCYW